MQAKPNCPLETGLRPCQCDLPRCPKCNYTEHDARFEMDHSTCPGTIPSPQAADPGDECDCGCAGQFVLHRDIHVTHITAKDCPCNPGVFDAEDTAGIERFLAAEREVN